MWKTWYYTISRYYHNILFEGQRETAKNALVRMVGLVNIRTLQLPNTTPFTLKTYQNQ
jgi:hypothetical protein